MKRTAFFAMAIFLSLTAMAQSFHVTKENVSEAHNLSKIGEITFGGNSFTLGSRSYDLSNVYDIEYNENSVADNTVLVNYNGSSANVVIAANIASKVDAKVRGAHVTLLQSSSVTEEITYTLTGTSNNGSLYMDGSFKATFQLDNLTLCNPDSAAINIQDGKRIDIVMKAGTVNTLTDGIKVADDGSDSHNACLYVDGHTEFSGAGSLVVNAKVKHGITSDEYCLVKASAGSISVKSAPGDGLHVGQYFHQLGGDVSVTCVGDGLDVGAKKDASAEKNGQVIIEGGKLNIKASGDAVKGIKCDAAISISNGDISIDLPANATYDSSKKEITSGACIKPGGTFTMTGGTVYAVATGSGGKVLNSTGNITFSGGKFTGATCGEVFEYGSDDTKPQGVKCDGDITISGGEVYVAASEDKGTAFKTDSTFAINGGTVMGIGGKATSASTSSTQKSKKYTKQKISGGMTASYDGVSFVIPAEYSNSEAHVIVSKPGM